MIDKTFVDAITALQRTAQRPSTIQDEHRRFVYNDRLLEYVEVDRVVKQTGAVGNVECLIALVKEEALRRANTTGEWMTVTFDANGAYFSPDDRVRLDGYTYRRTFSPEWERITRNIGLPMKHVEFLRLLQSLRHVLANASATIAAFRSVDVSRAAKIASSPTIRDGKAAVSLAIEMTVNMGGGASTLTAKELTSTLDFVLPFARGGAKDVTLEAEVTAEIAREGEKETLLFGFVIPDIEAVGRQAREREVQDFRIALHEAGLSRVLILENF